MVGAPARGPESRRGFTLAEMLFVVLIIATLATLVLPNYRVAQRTAQGADVLGRMSAINVALANYEADGHTVVPFTGPVGQAPEFLRPYADHALFAGPAAITLQLTRTGDAAPVLVIRANGDAEAQILLAAASTMGPPRAVLLDGGSGLLITMTD